MANYANSCIEKLGSAGFAPSQTWQTRSIVSVSENGKTYILPLVPPKSSAVFQIDGNIIKDGSKCDKLVIVSEPHIGAAVFVELKGKDIAHAIDQLEATIINNHFCHKAQRGDILRARIVTSGCGPASSSQKILADAKIRFLKRYCCDLRVLKNRQPDSKI
ncbi:MAG: hypothetical protein NC102_09950 [Clostridium sp.]|nr:hypothetical protein [Clostridium sp.]